MPLTTGTKLGPYTIVAPLGAGGMGEVYRATDTRLKRQVAIKILPAALASDPERLARFQREAEALASLNHPNIAAIYGFESADGANALVMELVEGPTLADRIARSPIPYDEVLPIATQIADALEAAHERGIVHRDLKPANVKVRDDGTVKVLDFGLAKLGESGSSSRVEADPSQSPTLVSPAAVTGVNVILGTAAYMSPEQARGRAVDKRTDVWAFGAVLYEMLSGARAFDGEDVADVMAAVVKSTPRWAALPSDVPPHVVALIQRCLEKDRQARIGDMAVARFLLAGHATLASPPSAATTIAPAAPARDADAASPRWRQALPFVVVATLAGVVVGGAASWLMPRGAVTAPGLTHLQMSIAPADSLVGSFASVRPSRTAVAVAPDGRSIVVSGVRNGVLQLYVRGLDRVEATPLPGTEYGVAPFFSPDGAWIGFSGDNKIKKVPAAGGPVETICDAASPNGVSASWGEGGVIVFATREGLSAVSASGGTPKAIGAPGSATGDRFLTPQFLPGGKDVLFTAVKVADPDAMRVMLQPIDGGERRVLLEGGSDARYVATGHLAYMKSGTLMAAPFDLRSRQVTGTPVALVDRVMHAVNASNGNDETAAGQFALSATGTLVYVDGGTFAPLQTAFTWVDRAGAARPLEATPPGSYLGPRLSPDGQKIAVGVRRVSPRGADLWVYDTVRGAPTRLTFNGRNGMPVWAPDGRRLAFASDGRTGREGLYVINSDGGGERAILPAGESGLSMTWSTTDVLVFLRRTPDGGSTIWTIADAGSPQPQPARVFLESRFSLQYPSISPDGRLMAYASNESGAFEIYVQPYPGPGEKTRVSTAGGREPLWSSDGRELLYRTFSMGKQSVYTTAIRSASPFHVDIPRLLFDATQSYDLTSPERGWDITSDGRRFLLMHQVPSSDKPVTTLHVVLDWTKQLPRLVPTK